MFKVPGVDQVIMENIKRKLKSDYLHETREIKKETPKKNENKSFSEKEQQELEKFISQLHAVLNIWEVPLRLKLKKTASTLQILVIDRHQNRLLREISVRQLLLVREKIKDALDLLLK